ncbi:acetyl-CoA carboxylase, partial [Pavlovales sp. CCMP2436]
MWVPEGGEASRSVEKELNLVMDGYDKDVEPLVQKLLRALSDRAIFPQTVLDAMSNLGNKLPVALEMPLKKFLTTYLANKGDLALTRDLATAVGKGEPRESKRTVLSTIYAVVNEYSQGQRAHALRVFTSMLRKFSDVESAFVAKPMDAAILEL